MKAKLIFPITAILWGGVSVFIVQRALVIDNDQARSVATLWFLKIYLMCLFNLVCLMKSVANLQKVMSQTIGNLRTKTALILWGNLKIACLGWIGYTLWKGHPELSVFLARKVAFLGASTLVVVPLVGGLWWSTLNSADEKA